MRQRTVATLFTAAILSSFTSTSVSARTTFGGIIFLDSYGIFKNSANNSGGRMSGFPGEADNFSSLRMELPNITRLRASWSNEDDVTMFIEVGLGGASGSTNVNTRQAFGTYRIDDRWQILAGQTTSPFSPLFPNQLIGNNAPPSASKSTSSVGGNHNTGKGYGDFDGGRNPQVRFTYILPSNNGALAIAFLDPNQGNALDLPGDFLVKPQRDSILPRIDVGAALVFANYRIFPGFTYQRQSYNAVSEDADDTVTTWAASLGLQTATGPFELSGEFNIGQNWRNSSFSLGNSMAANRAGAAVLGQSGDAVISNSDSMSYWIDAGWRMTTKNTSSVIHFVYGKMESKVGTADTIGRTRYESTMIGLSWPIDLPWMARGLTVRPEVFLYDEGDRKTESGKIDFGREVLAGIQLQYTF